MTEERRALAKGKYSLGRRQRQGLRNIDGCFQCHGRPLESRRHPEEHVLVPARSHNQLGGDQLIVEDRKSLDECAGDRFRRRQWNGLGGWNKIKTCALTL